MTKIKRIIKNFVFIFNFSGFLACKAFSALLGCANFRLVIGVFFKFDILKFLAGGRSVPYSGLLPRPTPSLLTTYVLGAIHKCRHYVEGGKGSQQE